MFYGHMNAFFTCSIASGEKRIKAQVFFRDSAFCFVKKYKSTEWPRNCTKTSQKGSLQNKQKKSKLQKQRMTMNGTMFSMHNHSQTAHGNGKGKTKAQFFRFHSLTRR